MVISDFTNVHPFPDAAHSSIFRKFIEKLRSNQIITIYFFDNLCSIHNDFFELITIGCDGLASLIS